MIRLELSTEDANLLREQLKQHIAQLDRELVRTDQHNLQHALARDVGRLREVEQQLAALLREAEDR